MSEFWSIALAFVLSYVAGAIPFGLLIVWMFKGKDLRGVESGRTGGTNAMRAAGFIAGLFTALLDVLKGYSTFWIVSWLAPDLPWVSVTAALMAILGHNYSIFLLEKRIGGGIRLRGGAGGATTLGGAMALWPSAGLIILPVVVLVYIFVGYASITTMSIAFVAGGVFLVRAFQGLSPWVYVLYGVAALLIVMWALRPNLARLRNGTERVVGLRALMEKRRAKKKDLSSKAVVTKPSRRQQAGKIKPYAG